MSFFVQSLSKTFSLFLSLVYVALCCLSLLLVLLIIIFLSRCHCGCVREETKETSAIVSLLRLEEGKKRKRSEASTEIDCSSSRRFQHMHSVVLLCVLSLSRFPLWLWLIVEEETVCFAAGGRKTRKEANVKLHLHSCCSSRCFLHTSSLSCVLLVALLLCLRSSVFLCKRKEKEWEWKWCVRNDWKEKAKKRKWSFSARMNESLSRCLLHISLFLLVFCRCLAFFLCFSFFSCDLRQCQWVERGKERCVKGEMQKAICDDYLPCCWTCSSLRCFPNTQTHAFSCALFLCLSFSSSFALVVTLLLVFSSFFLSLLSSLFVCCVLRCNVWLEESKCKEESEEAKLALFIFSFLPSLTSLTRTSLLVRCFSLLSSCSALWCFLVVCSFCCVKNEEGRRKNDERCVCLRCDWRKNTKRKRMWGFSSFCRLLLTLLCCSVAFPFRSSLNSTKEGGGEGVMCLLRLERERRRSESEAKQMKKNSFPLLENTSLSFIVVCVVVAFSLFLASFSCSLSFFPLISLWMSIALSLSSFSWISFSQNLSSSLSFCLELLSLAVVKEKTSRWVESREKEVIERMNTAAHFSSYLPSISLSFVHNYYSNKGRKRNWTTTTIISFLLWAKFETATNEQWTTRCRFSFVCSWDEREATVSSLLLFLVHFRFIIVEGESGCFISLFVVCGVWLWNKQKRRVVSIGCSFLSSWFFFLRFSFHSLYSDHSSFSAKCCSTFLSLLFFVSLSTNTYLCALLILLFSLFSLPRLQLLTLRFKRTTKWFFLFFCCFFWLLLLLSMLKSRAAFVVWVWFSIGGEESDCCCCCLRRREGHCGRRDSSCLLYLHFDSCYSFLRFDVVELLSLIVIFSLSFFSSRSHLTLKLTFHTRTQQSSSAMRWMFHALLWW